MFSCVRLFATPWTVACQAPLSMGFPKQEYWSGLPFPAPGDLPNPGIELTSLVSPALAVDSLPLASPGKPEDTDHIHPCYFNKNAEVRSQCLRAELIACVTVIKNKSDKSVHESQFFSMDFEPLGKYFTPLCNSVYLSIKWGLK